MTFGLYEKFPAHIHRVESFSLTITSRALQQRLIQVFYEINRKEFSFEEVTNPTITGGKVIFEFGLADAEGFSYLDEEETKKALNILAKENLHTIDFFCGIRYYKGVTDKKTALKFDYYILRTIYSRGTVEIQVHHERGPRYVSPEDLTLFIFNKINEISTKKLWKKLNPQ